MTAIAKTQGRVDMLRLWHTPGLGAQRIARLWQAFGTARAALEADPQQWAQAGVPPETHPSRHDAAAIDHDIQRDLDWEKVHADRSILTRACPGYPPLLAELPDPPPVLYLQGDHRLLTHAQIAIVGSRDATPPGRRHAARFAHDLTVANLVITSGLALGIDAEAHAGALAAHDGRTIAVMATGPDRIYPARHRRLAHRIADHGLLVSLWPVGTVARPGHFPARNRVISGLALGTLIVEAAERSGSLVTARLAMEQNRQVYAIPGSIDSSVSRGCHRLIRDGALLVESADDILDDLADWLGVPDIDHDHASSAARLCPTDGVSYAPDATHAGASIAQTPKHRIERPPAGHPAPEAVQPPSDAQARILEAMGFDPVDPDTLATRVSLTVPELSSILVALELGGFVARSPNGRHVRTPPGLKLDPP